MAGVYAGADIVVRGYVKEVTHRGDFATLHVEVPGRTYEGKTYPAQVHKFDVTKAFDEAAAGLAQGARVKVEGRSSGREWTAPDGVIKVIISWRMSALVPCNELPIAQPPVDAELIPF